jgi:hypothetical protein
MRITLVFSALRPSAEQINKSVQSDQRSVAGTSDVPIAIAAFPFVATAAVGI